MSARRRLRGDLVVADVARVHDDGVAGLDREHGLVALVPGEVDLVGREVVGARHGRLRLLRSSADAELVPVGIVGIRACARRCRTSRPSWARSRARPHASPRCSRSSTNSVTWPPPAARRPRPRTRAFHPRASIRPLVVREEAQLLAERPCVEVLRPLEVADGHSGKRLMVRRATLPARARDGRPGRRVLSEMEPAVDFSLPWLPGPSRRSERRDKLPQPQRPFPATR